MMQKRGTTWQSDFAIGVVLLVAAAALPFLDPTTYVIRQLTVFFIWATVVTQWNLVFGVAGIFSLAQLALFAFGGYGTAMMAYFLDWSLWATLPWLRSAQCFQHHHRLGMSATPGPLRGPAYARDRPGLSRAYHHRHRLFQNG